MQKIIKFHVYIIFFADDLYFVSLVVLNRASLRSVIYPVYNINLLMEQENYLNINDSIVYFIVIYKVNNK